MKFFLDTANLEEIREVASWGVLDGVTTNPSLCSKENIKVEDNIREICALVGGPVSAECVSLRSEEIVPISTLTARARNRGGSVKVRTSSRRMAGGKEETRRSA